MKKEVIEEERIFCLCHICKRVFLLAIPTEFRSVRIEAAIEEMYEKNDPRILCGECV